MQTPPLRGERTAPRANPWVVLATSLTGVFATGVTVTLLSVSLVTIAEDLDTTTATLTWLVTGPMLGAAVVGPAAGKAGDLFGHRRVYLLGLGGAKLLYQVTNFNAGGFLPGFYVRNATLVLGAGIAVLLVIASGIVPAMRAARLSVVTALRSVE